MRTLPHSLVSQCADCQEVKQLSGFIIKFPLDKLHTVTSRSRSFNYMHRLQEKIDNFIFTYTEGLVIEHSPDDLVEVKWYGIIP